MQDNLASAENVVFTVLEYYEKLLSRRGYLPDASQTQAVVHLQQLYEDWQAYKARRNTRLRRLVVLPGLISRPFAVGAARKMTIWSWLAAFTPSWFQTCRGWAWIWPTKAGDSR